MSYIAQALTAYGKPPRASKGPPKINVKAPKPTHYYRTHGVIKKKKRR